MQSHQELFDDTTGTSGEHAEQGSLALVRPTEGTLGAVRRRRRARAAYVLEGANIREGGLVRVQPIGSAPAA